MTFPMGRLSQLMACKKVLRYMVRGRDCAVACDVSVPASYIPDIVACANMYNSFIYGMFWCDIALFGFFGSGRIYLSLRESWASFVVFPTQLTSITTTREVWSSACGACAARLVEKKLSILCSSRTNE